MAIIGGIEVRIVSKSTKEALIEYENPNPLTPQNELEVEKFIEAESKKEFQVHVHVKPTFEFFAAWGITIGVDIDGEAVRNWTSHSKAEVLAKQERKEPIVIAYIIYQEGSQYSEIGFSFGELDINEELDVAKEVLEEQAGTLGSIRVSIIRVNRKKLTVPSSPIFDYKKFTTAVAKEIVKNAHISHTLAPSEKKLVDTPEPRTMKSYRCDGKHGLSSVLIFRYRSHMHLELLGCNPVISTLAVTLPEQASAQASEQRATDNHNTTEQVEELPDNVKRQELIDVEELQELRQLRKKNQDLNLATGELTQAIEELRKEMAEIKEIKGKMAKFIQTLVGETSSTGPAPTSSMPVISVKRERIKEEDGDEGSRRTSTPGANTSKRVKTVDLTGD